jgi:hypothetical protein
MNGGVLRGRPRSGRGCSARNGWMGGWIVKTSWPMRYGEVIVVSYGSYTKHMKWEIFRNFYVAAGGRPIKQWILRGYFSQWCPCVEGTCGKVLVTHNLNWTLWLCGYWFSIVWSHTQFLSRISTMMAEYFVIFLSICITLLRHYH